VRTKTAYRSKESSTPETSQPITPSIETNGEAPAATVVTHNAEPGTPVNEAVREALNKASVADAAAEALKGQLETLKRGEAMQRQHAEMHLKVAEAEHAFLQAHPELMQHQQITQHAAGLAQQQGHVRGSAEFNEAVLRNFHQTLKELEQQVQEPPPMYRPAPQPEPSERPRSDIVSAPVSREAPSAGDGSRASSRSITLSAEERHFARTIGLSEAQYAQQKMRLQQAKATGDVQS
jgi:hypothetical protein